MSILFINRIFLKYKRYAYNSQSGKLLMHISKTYIARNQSSTIVYNKY